MRLPGLGPTRVPTESHSPRPRHTRRESHWSFDKGRFGTRVSEVTYRGFWCLVVVIYLLDGLYLVGVTELYYWLLNTPAVTVSVQVALHVLPVPTLRAIVWVFPVLATCHLLTLVQILWCSCRKRQLMLCTDEPKAAQTAVVPLAQREPEQWTLTHGALWSSHEALHQHMAKWTKFLTNWVYPFVTLDGKRFDVWFTIQELVQIVSQTYQCYSMSRLVTTKWINNLAIGSTFLNCISSSLIRLFVPENLPRQRFLCVLSDCCINFVQATVIPCIIFYRYYRVYDNNLEYFPDEYIYNDAWYVEAVHELDQILIVSYFDFFMTTLPHFNFLRSLRGLAQLLRPGVHQHGQPVSVQTTGKHRGSLLQSMVDLARVAPKLNGWGAYGVLSFVYGFVIISCHLVAHNSNPIATANCRSHSNPWFTTGFACSVVEINCHRSAIDGDRRELASILEEFDAQSASVLIFEHCPRLDLPPIVRKFSNIVGIDLYNSTLVRWDAEAGIDREYHPVFNYLIVEMVNLTAIPTGILSPNLPATFGDVEFFETNLTTVPSDLDLVWPNIKTLFLEFCRLKTLPKSIVGMPLWFFSVVGNAIEEFEPGMFDNELLNQFRVSNNPLKSLPPSIGQVTDLFEFTFENTSVSEVPEWLQSWALENWHDGNDFVHSAVGTPFCANGALASEYQRRACATYRNTSRGCLPIDFIVAARPY